MATIADIAETQRSLEALITRRMEEFEKKLGSSSSKAVAVEMVGQDFTSFRDFDQDMFNLLRQQIAEISRSVDTIETRHRRKYLLLSGVPEKADEDVPSVVISILQKHLSMTNLSSSSIRMAHRLGMAKTDHNRPILFRFADFSMRSTAWYKKTMLKGTPFTLSEFLTKYRQNLFMQARRQFGMKKVWSSNGFISVRLPDGSRRSIQSNEDLNRLVREHSKAGCDEGPQAVMEETRASREPGNTRSEVPRTRRTVKKH